MNEDKRCRPILFHSEGPHVGDQVFTLIGEVKGYCFHLHAPCQSYHFRFASHHFYSSCGNSFVCFALLLSMCAVLFIIEVVVFSFFRPSSIAVERT